MDAVAAGIQYLGLLQLTRPLRSTGTLQPLELRFIRPQLGLFQARPSLQTQT
jgi:hypothetical protein